MIRRVLVGWLDDVLPRSLSVLVGWLDNVLSRLSLDNIMSASVVLASTNELVSFVTADSDEDDDDEDDVDENDEW